MAGLRLGVPGVFPAPDEDHPPWSDNMLSVLFTNIALTAYVSPISYAPHLYEALGSANFSLGLSAKDDMEERKYWEEVRSFLREAIASYLGRGSVLGRVIVYGESSDTWEFLAVLKEEVESAQSHQNRIMTYYGREWAASRGAAIFGNWCQRGLGRGDMSGCFPDLRPKPAGW